jgi:hypothetical protein
MMLTNKEIRSAASRAARGNGVILTGATLLALPLCGVSFLLFTVTQWLFILNSLALRGDIQQEMFGVLRWSYMVLAVLVITGILVGSFVELGYNRMIMLRVRGESVSFGMLFDCRKIWMNALMLRLLMAMKALLWTVFFVIPGIVALFNYALAPYLVAQDPLVSPPRAVYMSKYLMKGYRGKLARIVFGFAGWIFVGLITCGIGLFFVIPRMKAAVAIFCRERIALHDEEVRRLKQQQDEDAEVQDEEDA